MSNFGIGLGAFTDGLYRGVGLRRSIDANRRERDAQKREDAKRAEIDGAYSEARSAYDAAVADNVLTQAGQANADGSAPAFDVGSANDRATQKIGSFSDFFYKHQLPKVIDAHVKAGDLEGAQKLEAFAQDKKERKRTEQFGRALNAFYAGQTDGNYEPFANRAMDLLNSGDYGVAATGYDFVKDSNGSVAGVTFKLKEGDREYSHTFNSMEDVAGFLAGEMSPESRIKRLESQQAGADKFKSEIAKEEIKAGIGLSKDLALEEARHANRLQLEAAKTKQTGSKSQQEYEYMRGVLEQAGFSSEEIRDFVPAMLKLNASEYRKGKSPEEYAQQLMLELIKSPMNQGKSIEELQKRVNEVMQAVSSAAQAAKAPQPGITGVR